MRLGYLVSSHVSYAAPRARLLASAAGLPLRVVVGGHAARRATDAAIEVPYRAFDLTALIDFAEHPAAYPDWTHVFLLHDTMEVGARTDQLVRQADPAKLATAVWGGQCNLALCRADYLRDQVAALQTFKDCPKGKTIAHEGWLWRQLPLEQRGEYPGGLDESAAPVAVYDGAPRRLERYTGVDLVKYKANWGQNRHEAEAAWVVQP